MSKSKVTQSVNQWVSQWVTRSPIELFWTAKNYLTCGLATNSLVYLICRAVFHRKLHPLLKLEANSRLNFQTLSSGEPSVVGINVGAVGPVHLRVSRIRKERLALSLIFPCKCASTFGINDVLHICIYTLYFLKWNLSLSLWYCKPVSGKMPNPPGDIRRHCTWYSTSHAASGA